MIAHRPPARSHGVFAVQTITCPSVPSATVQTCGRPPPTRPLHDVNLGGLQFRPMGNVGIWMRVVLVCETLTPHPSGHRATFVSSPTHHHDAKNSRMGLVDVVLGSGAKPGSQSAGGAELSRSFCSLAHRSGFIPTCEPHFAQQGFGIQCAEK